MAPTFAFSYERRTHEGITEATIHSYEILRGDVFAESEERIIRGSSAEDDGTRPLNHFFDPVHYRGLSIGFVMPHSEEWAQDTEGQGNYCDFGICKKRIGYEDKLFSSATDYSWNRAIYEYAYGDKGRALETLGHILHLIQDATVPAHVRNDQHLNHQGFGDPDPYEKYGGEFGLGEVQEVKLKSVPTYSDLGTYFYRTALFTNNNFVSKDTLFKKYEVPSLDEMEIFGSFARHPVYGHRVARVKYNIDRFGERINAEVITDDSKSSVSTDYWNLLSAKAIEMGAGVIDLFFREVEKEKVAGIIKARNVSAAEQETKKLALSGFSLAKALYGSSLTQGDVAELLNETPRHVAAVERSQMREWADGLEKRAVLKAEKAPEKLAAQARKEKAGNETTEPEERVLGVSTAEESPAPSITTSPLPPRSQPYQPGFGGGGMPAEESETSEPEPEMPAAPTVTSPVENAVLATTSVTFVGTTGTGYLVEGTYEDVTATTTADGSGNWQLSFSLSEGSGSASFVVTDGGGLESEATTRTVTIDLTAPAAPTVSISECSYSLSSSSCFLATTTAAASWGSVSGASAYHVYTNGSFLSSTTNTNATITLTDQATTTLEVVAYDAPGNAATSTPISAYAYLRPIVINEIGWAGTKADDADEWIELYNRSGRALTLNNVTLAAQGGTPEIELSGTIAAGGYYLIERTDDTVTSVTADLTVAFSGSGGGSGLSNNGEELHLLHSLGTATTTLDRTPAVETCSGWCAGANASSTGFAYSLNSGTYTNSISMERSDASASGSLASSWRSNDTYQELTGITDSLGFWLFGSPKRDNSGGLPLAGWYCSPDTTSVVQGGTYAPTSGSCTYLSAFVRFQTINVGRYGGLYRGAVGSSTEINRHSLGNNDISSLEQNDTIVSPVSGESFFVAIWEIRQGVNSDAADFASYWTTGSPAPPHDNYRVIEWTYEP